MKTKLSDKLYSKIVNEAIEEMEKNPSSSVEELSEKSIERNTKELDLTEDEKSELHFQVVYSLVNHKR